MSWRNVDHELLNLSLTHRLQVICDRVDMPVFAQRSCWLNDWPGPSDEFPKGTPQKLGLNNRIELQRVFEPRGPQPACCEDRIEVDPRHPCARLAQASCRTRDP